MHLHYPEITKFEHQVTKVFQNRQGPILVSEYHYRLPDGSRKEMEQVVEEFQKGLTFDHVGETMEREVRLPEGTILLDSQENAIANVVGVKIEGVLRQGDVQTVEVNGRDKVWLFMKAIFEEKTFMISHEGEIRDVS
jgi:hypothetical protein